MASKHSEGKKETESLTFARYLANELDAIQSVRLRKHVQLQVMQCLINFSKILIFIHVMIVYM